MTAVELIEAYAAGKRDFQEANLQGADLRCADLRKADLRGANLRWANLQGANLQGANLQGANLRGADLRCADLRKADLRGANLQEANLRGVDLQEANLRGANLQEADLRGANLQEANLAYKQDDVLEEESITLSKISVKTFPFSKESGRLCFLLKEPSRKIVVCGCYINTLQAFEQRCKEKYGNDPVQAYEVQIAYLKSI
jgi:GAF domain-containing protein